MEFVDKYIVCKVGVLTDIELHNAKIKAAKIKNRIKIKYMYLL